tara:strand:- start:48455 stop:49147 length:693 start_codon:yes stop_codon:yes gene_type:complete
MKRLLITLLVLTSLQVINAQEQYSETTLLGDFKTLIVYAGIEVNLIKGDDNKIVISDNNLDRSTFGYKIKNKVLKLKSGIDKKLSLGKIFVDVYYKSEIDEIKLFQGSKLLLKDTITQTNLNIKVKEGSSLEGYVVTEKIKIEVASGGSVTLTGNSLVVEIIANTGGICSTEELESEQTKITANIGSVVYSKSSVLMDIKSTTGSIVRVYGKPKKLITKTLLGGSIKQME